MESICLINDLNYVGGYMIIIHIHLINLKQTNWLPQNLANECINLDLSPLLNILITIIVLDKVVKVYRIIKVSFITSRAGVGRGANPPGPPQKKFVKLKKGNATIFSAQSGPDWSNIRMLSIKNNILSNIW